MWRRGSAGCAAAGVEQGVLGRVELVLGDEAPGFDPPQALADAEVRKNVMINKEKLENFDDAIDASSLIAGKYIIAQKGKKNYFLLIAK